MSRPIKFRAWDGTSMYFADMAELCNGYKSSDFRIASQEAVQFNIMQFTGLHDCDGNEIYEGDIVCCEFYNSQEIKTVKWGTYGWSPFEYDGGGEASVHDCKIIGNIHQNPELLK